MQSNLQLISLYRGTNPLSQKAFKIFYSNKWTSAFLQSLNSIKLLLSNLLPTKLKLPVVLLFIFFIAIGTVTKAQITYTWNGTNSSAWNSPANWAKTSGTSYPGTSNTDIVVIPGSLSRYPTVGTSSYTIGRISTLGSGASISGTGALTISASGTTSASNSASIGCPLNVNANTSFSCTGSNILSITGAITGSAGVTITKAGSGGDLQLGTVSVSGLTINSSSNGSLSLGGTTTVVGMLTLTNGILSIGANTLVVNGGITRTGGFLSGNSSSNLILSGTVGNESLYFASNKEELKNLTINHTTAGNSTSKLYTVLSVYGGISFGSSKDILDLNDQHVTLKSDASATAYVGEIKGTLSNATNVTVERYIDGTTDFTFKRAWRLLSFPVTGQTIRDAWAGAAANSSAPTGEANNNIGTIITGHGYSDGAVAAAAGFDWFSGLGTTTTSSIRYYNTAHSWSSAYNTPSTLSTPDKEGYMLYVRGDRSVATAVDYGYTVLKPTGTLKQGDQTIAVSELYTVIGNPYASPVDVDAVYNNSGNSSVIKRNFWVWDATWGTSGGYRAIGWNGSAYDMTGGSGGTPSDYLILNSGQAFFVEQQGAGSITIKESNKTTNTPQTMFRPMGTTGTVSSISIKLYEATGSTLGLQNDGVLARYNDIYSVSPNETYDAAKMNNFNENLSLVRNSRYLSIESRPYPTQADTLFIPFWNLKVRDYALTITSNKFAGLNQTARVIDKFTNTQKLIDMSNGTIIFPFSITSDPASTSLNRFTIVMTPSPTLAVTFTKIDASLIGNKVRVTWNTGSEVGVKSYDVEKSTDGIHFSKMDNFTALNAAMGNSYRWMDVQPFRGKNFYRIRSNNDNGQHVYSSIVVVQLNGKKGIQVTPTVISDQHFTLSLNDQPSGNYNLLLTNTSGQQVYQKMISNDGGKNSQVIDLGKTTIPVGVYTLSVSDAAGNKQNFRLLINH